MPGIWHYSQGSSSRFREHGLTSKDRYLKYTQDTVEGAGKIPATLEASIKIAHEKTVHKVRAVYIVRGRAGQAIADRDPADGRFHCLTCGTTTLHSTNLGQHYRSACPNPSFWVRPLGGDIPNPQQAGDYDQAPPQNEDHGPALPHEGPQHNGQAQAPPQNQANHAGLGFHVVTTTYTVTNVLGTFTTTVSLTPTMLKQIESSVVLQPS
ncbi:MAG: hypothetical protein J3Q66DRAFT_409197 [Benniella sp.]|nr:MAG: hypothetical protein J3Q66DRAFT_409197 [Benniella sp.]